MIAEAIISDIKNNDPPGRFLAKDASTGLLWHTVSDEKARDKASQALRENAKKFKNELEQENLNVTIAASTEKPTAAPVPVIGHLPPYPCRSQYHQNAQPTAPITMQYGHPCGHATYSCTHAAGHEHHSWNFPYGYPQGHFPFQAPAAVLSMQPVPVPVPRHHIQSHHDYHHHYQHDEQAYGMSNGKKVHQSDAPVLEPFEQCFSLQPLPRGACQEHCWVSENESNSSSSSKDEGRRRQPSILETPYHVNGTVQQHQMQPTPTNGVIWSPSETGDAAESLDPPYVSEMSHNYLNTVEPCTSTEREMKRGIHSLNNKPDSLGIDEIIIQGIGSNPWFGEPVSPIPVELNERQSQNKRPLSPFLLQNSSLRDVNHYELNSKKIPKIGSPFLDSDALEAIEETHHNGHHHPEQYQDVEAEHDLTENYSLRHDDCNSCILSALGTQYALNSSLYGGERSSLSPLNLSPGHPNASHAVEDKLQNGGHCRGGGLSPLFGGLFMDELGNPVPPASLFLPLDGDDSFQPTIFSPKAA